MRSWVVGGSRGLGAAVGKCLAERGDEVVSLSRRGAPFFDLERKETWEVFEGRWDNLVFCQRNREGGWEKEIQVGLLAIQEFVEFLLPRRGADGGSIVLLGSPAATVVASEQPVEYHIAKAALAQWAKYSAVRLGPRGIRVNIVTPVRVERGSMDPRLAQATPLRRVPSEIDVAQAVAFLTSSAARAITGQEIVVDGGLSLIAPSNFILGVTS